MPATSHFPSHCVSRRMFASNLLFEFLLGVCYSLPMAMRLVPLLVLPVALAFMPLRSSVQRSVARYQLPKEEEDPAFKYYNRQDDDDDEELITQEMLWRDLLQDPKVKKRKKGGGYKPMDNRDALPFVVKVVTPDPYTSAKQKREEARTNTQTFQKQRPRTKKTNLMGGIATSIYSQTKGGYLEKVLGEFSLDKNTNCGDLVEVGDKEYEVQQARCQYKYAGGQRFVMVRKILEVKEVIRVAEENYLKRQFRKGETLTDKPPQLE